MKYKGNIHVKGNIYANDIKVGKSDKSNVLISPWSKLNEGIYSGLDGDTLGGIHISEFSKKNHKHNNYLELGHNESEEAHLDIQKMISIKTDFIEDPKLLNGPLENFFGIIELSKLITTEIEYDGDYVSTDWLVSADKEFSSIIYSVNTVTPKLIMSTSIFKENTTFFLKAKHNSQFFCSNWIEFKLKTPQKIIFINPPIIKTEGSILKGFREFKTFGDVGSYVGVEYKIIYSNGMIESKIDNNVYNEQTLFPITVRELMNDYISELHVRYITTNLKSEWTVYNISKMHDSKSFIIGYNTISTDYSEIDGAVINDSFALYGRALHWNSKGVVYVLANKDNDYKEIRIYTQSDAQSNSYNITAPSRSDYSYFGSKISSSENSDVTLITAPSYTYNNKSDHGRIYVYKHYWDNDKFYFIHKSYLDISFGAYDGAYIGGNILEISDNGISACFSISQSLNSSGYTDQWQSLVVFRRLNNGSHDFDRENLVHINLKVTSAVFSSDGNTLYIGHNDGNGHFSSIAIFKYVESLANNSSTWIKMDSIKPFIEIADFFGNGLSISNDGNSDFLAIGNPGTEAKGLVRIYNNESGQWNEVAKIFPPNEYNNPDYKSEFGIHLNISNGGKTITIGLPSHTYNNLAIGAIVIYDKVDNIWKQTNFIEGDNQYSSKSGNSFDVNKNGSSILSCEYRKKKILRRK